MVELHRNNGEKIQETIPECYRCQQRSRILLKYDIIANGDRRFFWWCDLCKSTALRNSPAISHTVVQEWFDAGRLSEEFWERGLRDDRSQGRHCAVRNCMEVGAELHHWVPYSLAEHFGNDWDDWPTIYLCRKHHREWHEVVTFYLPGFRDSERAQKMKKRFYEIYYEVVGI